MTGIPWQGLGKLHTLHQSLVVRQCPARNYGLVIFAADNGISRYGTSYYPPMHSHLLVDLHLRGCAPTACLLARLEKEEIIVDMGLAHPLPPKSIIDHNIRPGSRDFLQGDALVAGEVIAALEGGRSIWEEISGRKFDILGVGEIGIADTLCAAALTTAITGLSPVIYTGKGSGSGKAIARKTDIICRALKQRRPDSGSVLDLLSRFGGLEIAGLTGFISRAPEQGIPIMLDGYVTSVAALLASLIDQRVRDYLIAPSQGDEAGHKPVLNRLGLDYIFDLNMNHGEGLAAVLGLSLAALVEDFYKETIDNNADFNGLTRVDIE